MGDKTGIAWTDATWNPVTGCTKVSPGCANCYADKVAERFWPTQYPVVVYTTCSGAAGCRHEGGTCQPFTETRPRLFSDVMCHDSRLDQPLRWQRPRKVFVNSMSDLFHEDVPFQFIAAVYGVMASAEHHTFQVLTKREQRRLEFHRWLDAQRATGMSPVEICLHSAWKHGVDGDKVARPDGLVWPLLNVWEGVSVENQPMADRRVPALFETPGCIRFLSIEPLLAPVRVDLDRVDWVIVGGESGPDARPCALEWIESVVMQCDAAGVACFVKQLGAYVVSEQRTAPADMFERPGFFDGKPHLKAPNGEYWAWRAGLKSSKGADMTEWPPLLRVQQFPATVR